MPGDMMGLQIVDSYVEDTVVSETVGGGFCRMLQIVGTDGHTSHVASLLYRRPLTRCDCRLWQ